MTTVERQAHRRPQLSILTSLRFFAAAEVILYHFGRMSGVDLVTLYFGQAPSSFPGNFLDVATSAGHEAVTFFFVLSGFILTYVYAGADEAQGFAVRPRDFWWARFARLAPTFYLGLLISLPFLLVSFFVVHSLSLSRFITSLLLSPTFLQAWWPPVVYLWNFPSWSLSVEFLFYALFPVLAYIAALVPRRLLLGLAIVLVVVAAYGRAAIFDAFTGAPDPAHTFAIYFPPFSLPQFILGIALGRVFIHGSALSRGVYRTILLLGLAGTVVAFGWQSHLPAALAWSRTETGTVSLLFGAIIFGAAGLAGSFRLLESRTMVFLGDASYSMYILHIPILLWWKAVAAKVLHLSLPPLLDFAVMVALVIGLAALNHAFLEPSLRRWLVRAATAAR